jgi:uncharacterized protein YjbJ (UPF0337 family)
MNWDRIAGNWKQMKGKGALKERWGKITDDELDQLGCAKHDAEKQVSEWESRQ